MGTDPVRSVTDPDGAVWNCRNLSVCDAALHPINDGFNPVLTVMSLAFRTGRPVARAVGYSGA
jgi:choline dehydrogenase-like flavoprotein